MHYPAPFVKTLRGFMKKIDAFHRIRTDTVCGLNAFSLPIGVGRLFAADFCSGVRV